MTDFHSFRLVKARKRHRCEHCGKTIEAGETHRSSAQVWQGDFHAFREHAECYEVWRKLNFVMREVEYYDTIPFLCNDELDEDREWITTEYPIVAARLWGQLAEQAEDLDVVELAP